MGETVQTERDPDSVLAQASVNFFSLFVELLMLLKSTLTISLSINCLECKMISSTLLFCRFSKVPGTN